MPTNIAPIQTPKYFKIVLAYLKDIHTLAFSLFLILNNIKFIIVIINVIKIYILNILI